MIPKKMAAVRLTIMLCHLKLTKVCKSFLRTKLDFLKVLSYTKDRCGKERDFLTNGCCVEESVNQFKLGIWGF